MQPRLLPPLARDTLRSRAVGHRPAVGGLLGRLAVVAGCAWLATGCGHPASREECQEIFDRSAAIELELQNVSDPETVKARVETARADKGEELMEKCVGKRITDRAMRCVREANTAKELEACLM